MSPYFLLIYIQRVAGCVTYRTLLKNQMQLPQSFDHKLSTVFFLSSFLIPAHASRYLWHIVVPPFGPGHNCHCATSWSLLQSQNAQEHRLSLSSFVFDWIKLPCLVRVLVALPSLSLPLSPISLFPVRMSQCCAMHVGQCTHSFIHFHVLTVACCRRRLHSNVSGFKVSPSV